jgi:hypothetical protein
MPAIFSKQVRGVMLLALRASCRTRVVLFLALLQILCALALPHAVQGDGTPAGDLEILLTYTLGFCFALQALSALWASCSLFAGEISSRRIQMSVVKPVGFAALWIGKWLALLALNAALLALVYALVYLQVRVTQRREGWAPEVVPAARHLARPLLPTPAEEAMALYHTLKREGNLPEDLSRAEILQTLEEQARERYDIINPGDELRLNFELVRAIRSGDTLDLRIRFDTHYGTRRHVRGVCRLAATQSPQSAVERRVESVTQNEIVLAFDAESFLPPAADQAAPRTFALSFLFEADDEQETSALLLRLRQDAVLLIPGGSFEMNLVRSALVQGCVLAALCAFGLTLSACFSFPVAAFAASVTLALIMISGGILPMVSKEDEKPLAGRIGITVLRATRYATRHATAESPLRRVVHGERISREIMLAGALWNLGLVPLALSLLACAVLRRRELADA